MAVTFSRDFEQTLHRSLAIANERHHKYATLEHLLLALLDDIDAVEVIRACAGDAGIASIQTNVINYLETELDEFGKEDKEADSVPTAGFQRTVQRAVIQAQSSGRDEINGADLLLAMFAEREAQATYFLQEQDFTRFDAVNFINGKATNEDRNLEQSLRTISVSVDQASKSAPEFKTVRGKIRFLEKPSSKSITERKAAVKLRCEELQRLCERRGNEQPELRKLAERYAAALRALRKDRGAYNLFLSGFDLELRLRTKKDAGEDEFRNPPIDGDMLFALRSLIVAHAGLVTLFPDVKQITRELDAYHQLGETLEPFRNQLLDPAIEQLASSKGIFDDTTKAITEEINELSDREKRSGDAPSEGTTAIKHSWLRGSLAALGRHILGQTKDSAKIVRDEALKEGTKAIIKDPDKLTKSIMSFLENSKDTLSILAEKLPSSFGWIGFLFSLLGMK